MESTWSCMATLPTAAAVAILDAVGVTCKQWVKVQTDMPKEDQSQFQVELILSCLLFHETVDPQLAQKP